MLELSALGLLQREPLHGYRLKQQLELFMSGCISVNYGAIYPMLKRLEERGDVVVVTDEFEDGGQNRKIYRITEQGRQNWRRKMLEHPQESWVKSRSRFIIKFFFFSDLNPEERIKLIEHRLRVCQLRQEYLVTQEIELAPIDIYQTEAWQRAKSTLELEVQWLMKHLRQEQERLMLEQHQFYAHSFEGKNLISS